MVPRGTAGDSWEGRAIPHSLLSLSFWGIGTGNPKGDLEVSVPTLTGKVSTPTLPQSLSLTIPLCKMGLNRKVDPKGCPAQRDSGCMGGAAVSDLEFYRVGVRVGCGVVAFLLQHLLPELLRGLGSTGKAACPQRGL